MGPLLSSVTNKIYIFFICNNDMPYVWHKTHAFHSSESLLDIIYNALTKASCNSENSPNAWELNCCSDTDVMKCL